jgi:hypothetical protein
VEQAAAAVKIEPPSTELPASKKGVFTTNLKDFTCTKHGSGKLETVALEAGCNNLLVAKFSTCCHETELSNLLLASKKAEKPAPELKKKPAGAEPAPAPPPAAEGVAEAAPPAAARYAILYYKNDNTIGIRAKFGAKNQLFSFGGKRSGKSQEQLREIAKEVLDLLETGASSEAARTRARQLAGQE